jgi:hypothetical protein
MTWVWNAQRTPWACDFFLSILHHTLACTPHLRSHAGSVWPLRPSWTTMQDSKRPFLGKHWPGTHLASCSSLSSLSSASLHRMDPLFHSSLRCPTPKPEHRLLLLLSLPPGYLEASS